MKLLVPTLVFMGLLAGAAGNLRAQANSPAAQAPSYEITGSVHSGKTPLPGVTVTAANTLTGKKFTAATISDGSFVFAGLPRGRYVVKTEFMGFAEQTKEIVLNPENSYRQGRF